MLNITNYNLEKNEPKRPISLTFSNIVEDLINEHRIALNLFNSQEEDFMTLVAYTCDMCGAISEDLKEISLCKKSEKVQ